MDIVRVRLQQLREAIGARDWDEVELQFDRVLRSVEKLDRLDGGGQQSTPMVCKLD